MTTTTVKAEATFERQHGIHPFATRGKNPNTGVGDAVTVVSQPNLGLSLEALQSLRGSRGFVLLPEGITLGGEKAQLPSDLSELRSQKSAIESDLKKVKEFSATNPDLIIALGSATFDGASNGNGARPKPNNSFLFYRGGRLAAHTNQQFPAEGDAEDMFSLEQARGGRTVRPDISGVVGADFVGESQGSTENDPHAPQAVVRFAQTVMVSSGVTLSRERLAAEGADPEEAVVALATGLFERREDVNEIIIADRVPDLGAVGPDGPLNAHILRQPA
ncbi:MAG TPA: hypothetical protein VFX79_03040 [Candidatus Saccharimonadales bacterium]|nr:hypothetical protein [Candidatus Saccharimonadales bacterium]